MDRDWMTVARAKLSSLGKRQARRVRKQVAMRARAMHVRLLGEFLEPRCLLTSSVLPLGNLPLAFEANEGQFDSQVNYLARGSGYTVLLTPGETIMSLRPVSETHPVFPPINPHRRHPMICAPRPVILPAVYTDPPPRQIGHMKQEQRRPRRLHREVILVRRALPLHPY